MQPAQNAFGMTVPPMREILDDRMVEGAIREMLTGVFSHLGIDGRAGVIIDLLLHHAKSPLSLHAYEDVVYALFNTEGLVNAIPRGLEQRSRLMHHQLQAYVLRGSILDLGCGSGYVGQMLAEEGHQVMLADVTDLRDRRVKESGLEFKLLTPDGSLPINEHSFDNTLCLYVLHHSDNPLKTIQEAQRVTKPRGRIIVMESVYGVDPAKLTHLQQETAEPFLALSPEQQRRTNIFFDHLWNRVLMYQKNPTDKINVPYNFNTPEGWTRLFENCGLEQEHLAYLGIDQLTVPEYHTLQVLRVRN